MSDERPVIAQIGNTRIVQGDGWWGGAGGKWAVRLALALLALAWLAGVVTVVSVVAAWMSV